MDIKLASTISVTPKVKVVGIGGCGCNAVQFLINSKIDNTEFICINTDAQNLKWLANSNANILQIGVKLTKGQGAGGDPEIGYKAALEDHEMIRDALIDTDMVFLTAGLGGGTGTGASQQVATIAKELGIVVISFLYQPFAWERGIELSKKVANKLQDIVDSQVIIDNNSILDNQNHSLYDAFERGFKILHSAVSSIIDIVTRYGFINLDFADVRTVLQGGGTSFIATGEAKGANSAMEAYNNAYDDNLLKNLDFTRTKKLLLNVIISKQFKLNEIQKLFQFIEDNAPKNCQVFKGYVFDDNLDAEQVKVTIIGKGDYLNPKQVEQPKAVQSEIKAKTAAKTMHGNAENVTIFGEQQLEPIKKSKVSNNMANTPTDQWSKTYNDKQNTFAN